MEQLQSPVQGKEGWDRERLPGREAGAACLCLHGHFTSRECQDLWTRGCRRSWRTMGEVKQWGFVHPGLWDRAGRGLGPTGGKPRSWRGAGGAPELAGGPVKGYSGIMARRGEDGSGVHGKGWDEGWAGGASARTYSPLDALWMPFRCPLDAFGCPLDALWMPFGAAASGRDPHSQCTARDPQHP